MQKYWRSLNDYIKITPRTLLIIFVLLIAIDVVTRQYWRELYVEPGATRLINSDIETIQNQRNYMDSSSAIKVMFLGDSQAYGSAVKNGHETTSAYLEKEMEKLFPGRDVDVYNYAFKGFGLAENYLILNYLRDSDIDLIIYNLSTTWFNRQEVIEHNNLLSLTNSYLNVSDLRRSDLQFEKSNKEQLNFKIGENVGFIWNFYKTRSAIINNILGKSLNQKLQDLKLALTNPQKLKMQQKTEEELFLPWFKKDWTEQFAKAGYKVGNINLNNENQHLLFYNLILDIINKKQIKAVIYTSPQNITMLREYEMIDENEWIKGRSKLKQLTTEQSKFVQFEDYTYIAESQHFTDSIHMNANGNEITAIRLAKDVTKSLGVENP